jgi:hypothetical protein
MSNATEPARAGGRGVWPAAVLAGLVAGAVAFALGRTFPVPPPAAAPSEAREVADSLVEKLKTGKYDEFASTPHLGAPGDAGKKVADLKSAIAQSREFCAAHFKRTVGEFELIRETPLGPSLARVLYLERFDTGGVVWGMGLFRAADGWRLVSVVVEPVEVAFPALR